MEVLAGMLAGCVITMLGKKFILNAPKKILMSMLTTFKETFNSIFIRKLGTDVGDYDAVFSIFARFSLFSAIMLILKIILIQIEYKFFVFSISFGVFIFITQWFVCCILRLLGFSNKSDSDLEQ